MKIYKQGLFHQTPLKILSFLSKHVREVFCEGEIKKITETSTGSVNQTLRLLTDLGIVSREIKGNVFLYKLNPNNYTLKYFKIFENLLYIHDFVKEVEPYSYQIILYGSCAQGLNTVDSDIDIFVKTEYKSEVKKVVNKYRAMDENFKVVILDPLEMASSKKEDEVFYNELKKGIILWDGKPAYEEI